MPRFALSGRICLRVVAVAAALAGAEVSNGEPPGPFQEIVVTAERRSTSLQDTPIALTALTERSLERSGVRDIRDLAALTPGLVVGGSAQFGEFPVAIRGIGSSVGGIGADDPVAVYVDGVYIGRPSGFMFEFVDIERVEVLRGPQGTLYGRNSVGGAIRLITKAPTEELEVLAEGQYGNFDSLGAQLSVSGPLGERVQGRAGVSYLRHDGYGVNLFDGRDVNDEEKLAVRGRLAFELSDAFDLELLGDLALFESRDTFKNITDGTGDPDRFNVNEDNHTDREVGGASVQATYHRQGTELRSITAWRFVDHYHLIDTDGTPVPIFRSVTEDLLQDQFSQELQLVSTAGGPLEWVLGLYYFREQSEFLFPSVAPQLNSSRTIIAENETSSFAAFGQLSYDLTERFHATLGLRYSYEEKDFFIEAPGTGIFPSIAPTALDDSWDALTPRFVLSYDLTDEVFLYGSLSRGFKSGGFNFTSAQSSFDPELMWAYEVGLKSRFADGLVQLNASAFSYDYSDLQVRVPLGPGFIEIQNAAAATVEGLEVEAMASPVDGLTLSAGLSYLDAAYDEFIQGSLDLSGNRLGRSPEWQVNLAGEYARPVVELGQLIVRVEYTSEDESWYTEQNVLPFGHDGYEIVNARVGFETEDERWRVSVFGKNLTDERYVSHTIPIGPFALGTFNRPRTYGVQVNYRY